MDGVVRAKGNSVVFTNNCDRTVSIPADVLRCVNQRFEYIGRQLAYVFYTFALLSFLSGVLSTLTHANQEDGLLDWVKIEGLVFGTVKEIASGILVLVPIQAVSGECYRAFALGKEYELSGSDRVPVRVVRFLSETRTLFYSHPFADPACANVRRAIR